MAPGYDREVQLEGDALDRARRAEQDLTAGLAALTEVVLGALQGPGADAPGVGGTKLSFGAGPTDVPILIVHGPEYCYVYDSTAGVCRPCTAAEEHG
ncbi:MAG: hypothetical protein ACT4RN_21715 [Pseudonocardia sp.]